MNFHKYSVLFLALFQVGLHTYAQKVKSTQNAIVLEMGGNGFAYSINYERTLSSSFYLRAGVSLWKMHEVQTEKSLLVLAYPVSINHLINLSHQKHFIETGVGIMNLITTGDLVEYKGITNYYMNPFANLGYRYLPAKNRMVYRAGLSPFLGTKSLTNPTEQGFQPTGSKVQLWGYAGIGFRF